MADATAASERKDAFLLASLSADKYGDRSPAIGKRFGPEGRRYATSVNRQRRCEALRLRVQLKRTVARGCLALEPLQVGRREEPREALGAIVALASEPDREIERSQRRQDHQPYA